MKTTKIQSIKTNKVIMYFINDTRVSISDFHSRVTVFNFMHKGNYNSSFTEKTKSGNYKHVSYY